MWRKKELEAFDKADSPRKIQMKTELSDFEKICRLQRHIDMMERLIGDCIIILSKRSPDHFTMEYSEEDVGIGANLLDLCYKIAGELAEKSA